MNHKRLSWVKLSINLSESQKQLKYFYNKSQILKFLKTDTKVQNKYIKKAFELKILAFILNFEVYQC